MYGIETKLEEPGHFFQYLHAKAKGLNLGLSETKPK